MSTIETKDTGRTREVSGTQHPIVHLLGRAGWGWYVSESVCNGAADSVRDFASEADARAHFSKLDGQACYEAYRE